MVLTGCGSSRCTILEPASEPVTRFSVLEIRDFTNNLSDADSIELANRFADRLYSTVTKDRKANPGESVFELRRRLLRCIGTIVLTSVGTVNVAQK